MCPVTIQSADKALKTVFEGTVAEQLNTKTNAFYNVVKRTNKNIAGKEMVKLAPYGINGGISAGSETGALPQANGNQYENFKSTTKNLYGTLAISDKSIEASKNDSAAFVRLLEAEMKGLLKAAKFNFSRMLYGDGSGKLTNCKANTDKTLLEVDSIKYLIEGLTIDIRDNTGNVKAGCEKRRILAIDRRASKILISGSNVTTVATDFLTVQDSYNNEITGLGAIFKSTGSLYGVDRTQQLWMVPYIETGVGAISDVVIQRAIDYQEENSDSEVDFIVCSSGVRRAYFNYLEATKRNVNTIELEGGFKAISFSGKAIVADKHVPEGTMDLLCSNDFEMGELTDWHWMDRDGGILKQVAGSPIWTATLVAYKELMCDKPIGQSRLLGITEV